MSHGSGDYVIAFTTSRDAEETDEGIRTRTLLNDEHLSPLFQAAVEATEEAIVNSLFKATDTKGYLGRTVEALPLEKVKEVFRKYGRLR